MKAECSKEVVNESYLLNISQCVFDLLEVVIVSDAFRWGFSIPAGVFIFLIFILYILHVYSIYDNCNEIKNFINGINEDKNL